MAWRQRRLPAEVLVGTDLGGKLIVAVGDTGAVGAVKLRSGPGE